MYELAGVSSLRLVGILSTPINNLFMPDTTSWSLVCLITAPPSTQGVDNEMMNRQSRFIDLWMRPPTYRNLQINFIVSAQFENRVNGAFGTARMNHSASRFQPLVSLLFERPPHTLS